MAKFAFAHIVLLSFASGGLTQSFNGFNAYNFMRSAPPEEPQVVEVIRWRQPVCITSGPGVQPCKVNHNYRAVQSSLKEDSDQDGKRVTKEAGGPVDLAKKLNQDESSLDFSSLESSEKDDSAKRSVRAPRAAKLPSLFSSRIRRFVRLENMGTSSLEEPAATVIRHRRYLRLGPMMARSPPKRQTVYVTKVVDSPVVATLVASTCLPDIGIPICDKIQHLETAHQGAPVGYEHQQPSSYQRQQPVSYEPQQPPSYEAQQPPSYEAQQPPSYEAQQPPSYEAQQPPSYEPQQQPSYELQQPPSYEPQQPPSYVPQQQPSYETQQSPSYAPQQQVSYAPQQQGSYAVQQQVSYTPGNSQGIADYPSYQIQYHPSQTTQRPDIGQTIEDFVNRPNYVQTNERPGVKPVLVVQPTPQPTLLEGINAFFMQNGNWFNVFSRPSSNQQNGGNQIVTSVVQLPAQMPSLQQIIYRPENDISDPNILTILNQNNPPGAGPPTETPGVFGGLFASPTRPEGAYQTTTTTTQAPSILDGLNNIFRPTNRPLVIERPDKIPIVVEKPVYVVEQPVAPGLLDIFQNPYRPTDVNASNGAEVITDPVYVLQRPAENPSLFGLLPNNWNIFSGPTTEANPDRPTVELTENLQQAQLVVANDHHAPTTHKPLVVQPHPPSPQPAYHHHPPSAAPAVINVVPVQTIAAAPAPAPEPVHNYEHDAQPHTNTTATGFIQSVDSTIGWQGASFNLGVGLGTITQTNPAKAGINLNKSPADSETDLEGNVLPEPGTATKLISGEVESPLVDTVASDDSAVPADLNDRSLLTEGTEEVEKIEVSGVEEQIGNEA